MPRLCTAVWGTQKGGEIGEVAGGVRSLERASSTEFNQAETAAEGS